MADCTHERQPDLPCAWPGCPATIPEDRIPGTKLDRIHWWDDAEEEGNTLESIFWTEEWAWMEVPEGKRP